MFFSIATSTIAASTYIALVSVLQWPPVIIDITDYAPSVSVMDAFCPSRVGTAGGRNVNTIALSKGIPLHTVLSICIIGFSIHYRITVTRFTHIRRFVLLFIYRTNTHILLGAIVSCFYPYGCDKTRLTGGNIPIREMHYTHAHKSYTCQHVIEVSSGWNDLFHV